MRIADIFLCESLSNTLAIEAWEAVTVAVRKWGENKFQSILNELIPASLQKIKDIDEQIDNEEDTKIKHKLMDRRSNIISDAYDKFAQGIEHETSSYPQELVYQITDTIERTLQDVTKKYIESKYGKIEPIEKSFDKEHKTKNLYYLKHILVHLKTDALYKGGPKMGQPKTGGGYFTRFPDKMEFLYHRYSKDYDWANELSQGIVIYLKKSDLVQLARTEIKYAVQMDWWGEIMGEEPMIDQFLKKIIDVYVHEVGHLEQHILKDKRKQQSKYAHDISLLPASTKKRKREKNFWSNKTARFGKRGHPHRLQNDEFTTDEFVEYLATRTEIDAHAAGAAADLVGEWREEYNDRWYSSARRKQEELNNYIDYKISDLKSNYYYPDRNSQFSSYYTYIRSAIDKQGTNKEKLYRKVWRLFMTKLVKYLLAYKKELPDY